MKALPESVKEPLRLWMERLGVRPKRSFGLDQLDIKLAEHVCMRGGFFVEAGANDGVSQSNTAYFERYQDWRGILVEPIPQLAERCRVNRPKAIVEQCALVSSDSEEDTVEMTYCNLMSLVSGARGSKDADQAHLDAGRRFLEPDEETCSVRVPARTLSSALTQHGVECIDLLSLDVEGFEADVLRGLDFGRYAPRHILVEVNDPASVEEVLGCRYELVTQLSHHDRLYRLRQNKSR